MNSRKTKQEVVIATLLLLIAIFANGLYIDNKDNEHQGIIRFHVIANSDNKADQKLKLQVRDKLLGKIEKEVAHITLKESNEGMASEQIIRNYVENNQSRINAWAREVIREEGYDYSVNSKLGVTYIPDKKYGKTFFPAGYYEALNVVIGKGKGHNWWCVLFPPLCLIDSASGDYSKELGITQQEGIVLKSKIKEMLER